MNGDETYEVVLRIKRENVRCALDEAEQKRQGVTPQKALEGCNGAALHEDLSYGAVVHAHGFEGAYGGDVPEHHYKKAGNHVETVKLERTR